MMTVQMLPSVLPTYALMGFSLLQTMAILLPSMLLHALVSAPVSPTVSESGGARSSACPNLRLPLTLTPILL